MNTLQDRIIGIQDWAVYFFILAFLFLVLSKVYFPVKFYDYIRLIYTDKFLRIYKDSPRSQSGFYLLLFITKTISFSFLSNIREFSLSGACSYWYLYDKLYTLTNLERLTLNSSDSFSPQFPNNLLNFSTKAKVSPFAKSN